jgi:hypothetical protein
MSESAVAAAVAVAAEHGLRADDPVVLSDAWHVLVHLRPLPLVARVSSGRPYREGPSEEDVIRELAVASHAARAGAPVVPPSDLLPPGPHRSGGHVVAFWRYVEPSGGEVDPAAAGRGLRVIHEALSDYDGELPALHTADLVEILDGLEPSADVELLRELGTRRVEGPAQAVHGDAHLWNCLPGPLWHDFETAAAARGSSTSRRWRSPTWNETTSRRAQRSRRTAITTKSWSTLVFRSTRRGSTPRS